jgi:hypothetical protein
VQDGRAFEQIDCKSHFHAWLGLRPESHMWLVICKKMWKKFGNE